MSQPATTSGSIAVGAATVVTARPARLLGIVLAPAAAASAITVYDNASASSGTLIGNVQAVANGTTINWDINGGVECNNGITVTVTGAAATAIVYYIAQ
jgi:hypothetical protein